MTHIVIPAAGEGKRFAAAGYPEPKPLIDVFGAPMIQRVIENCRQPSDRVTVVSQVPLPGVENAEVVLTGPTRGAVETVLAAGIGDGPLMIANCDQLVGDAAQLNLCPVDGALLVFPSSKPHHSYVELGGTDARVLRIAEKLVISDLAVSGVYWFRDGRQFAEAARRILDEDRTVHGELYVSTVIAEMIAQGVTIWAYEADTAILGTPEELEAFVVANRIGRGWL